MKAIWAADIPKRINVSLNKKYVLERDTSVFEQEFYEGILPLAASHYLEIDLNSLEIRLFKYWDISVDQVPDDIWVKMTTANVFGGDGSPGRMSSSRFLCYVGHARLSCHVLFTLLFYQD